MKVEFFGLARDDVDSSYLMALENGDHGPYRNHRIDLGEVFKLGNDWQFRLVGRSLPSSECFKSRKDAARGLLTEIMGMIP